MKKIIVTTSWDDGHWLDLKLSTLMKKYKISGTFYVSPNNREFKKGDLLDNAQIKTLSRDFEIGAHTMTHPRLDKLSSDAAGREIEGSKQYLEEIIGRPVTSFCYPGGYYSAANAEQVKNSGFRLARTTKRFSIAVNKNFYELPTSLQAYDHWLDAWPVANFTRFNVFEFARSYRRWDYLAALIFDQALRHGGVFHLWGHSWEIDRHDNWQRLENVFKYISHRPGAKYAANKELV